LFLDGGYYRIGDNRSDDATRAPPSARLGIGINYTKADGHQNSNEKRGLTNKLTLHWKLLKSPDHVLRYALGGDGFKLDEMRSLHVRIPLSVPQQVAEKVTNQ
jgi:hypothetical protein